MVVEKELQETFTKHKVFQLLHRMKKTLIEASFEKIVF